MMPNMPSTRLNAAGFFDHKVKIPFFDMEQECVHAAATIEALDGVIQPLEIYESDFQMLVTTHRLFGVKASQQHVLGLTGCKYPRYIPRYLAECGETGKRWAKSIGLTEEGPEEEREPVYVTLDVTPSWWSLAGQSIGSEMAGPPYTSKGVEYSSKAAAYQAHGFKAMQKLASLTKARYIGFGRFTLWVEVQVLANSPEPSAWQEQLRLEMEMLSPKPRARAPGEAPWTINEDGTCVKDVE